MKRRRRSKQYQFNAAQQFNARLNGAGPQAAIVTEPVDVPSAFMATVSVSGSLAAVGGAFSLTYGWGLEALLPLAAAPWLIYALGKLAYLIIVLISDIASLFEPDGGSPALMPITKE